MRAPRGAAAAARMSVARTFPPEFARRAAVLYYHFLKNRSTSSLGTFENCPLGPFSSGCSSDSSSSVPSSPDSSSESCAGAVVSSDAGSAEAVASSGADAAGAGSGAGVDSISAIAFLSASIFAYVLSFSGSGMPLACL